MKSASVCIINNKLLKGFKCDTKSELIVKFLHVFGFNVKKVLIIGDNKDDITYEIEQLSNNTDIVTVCCDNNQMLQIHKLLAQTLETEKNGIETQQNGDLLVVDHNELVILSIKNIYLMPQCSLERYFKIMQKHFYSITKQIVHNRFFYVNFSKQQLSYIIDRVQTIFTDVNIYNETCIQNKMSQKIILESSNLNMIVKCEQLLKEQIHIDGGKLQSICSLNSIYKFIERSHIFEETMNVIETCFTKYKLNEIFLSFNGGKDCTVLLYLVMAYLNKKYTNRELPKIQCVYIRSENAFNEIGEFINETVDSYNLPLITIDGNIRDALAIILRDHPSYKAVLMGTRRTDPFSETLEYFKITDKNWPQMMRVSPILEWSYSDVWNFLRDLQIPYCSLYDFGYTSLGNKDNTHCNSALKVENGYLPAYLLHDGNLERAGRGIKQSTSSQ